MVNQRRTGAGKGREKTGERPEPVPRDMPDQQWQGGQDPWGVPAEESPHDDEEALDEELPDTDEAGTGKHGAAYSGSVHPEQPVPDEPPA